MQLSEEELQLFHTYADRCSGYRYTDLCKGVFNLEQMRQQAKTFLRMTGCYYCTTVNELFRNLLTALVVSEFRGVNERIRISYRPPGLEEYSAAVVISLLGYLYPSYGFQHKFQDWSAIPAYRQSMEFARDVLDYLIDHLSEPVIEVDEYYHKQVERLLKL